VRYDHSGVLGIEHPDGRGHYSSTSLATQATKRPARTRSSGSTAAAHLHRCALARRPRETPRRGVRHWV